ncbi:MAG: hypothetical protein OXB99_03665 [Acidimicrobiaceae bacterium]|nr:hypothetical protein [Acidimicrobiaceae bacterium]
MTGRAEQRLKPGLVRQKIRAFPRDQMLQTIARIAAEQSEIAASQDGPTEARISEGMWLQLAGICATSNNNHRNKSVESAALWELVNAVYLAWSPVIDDPDNEESWHQYLSYQSYVQMSFQPEPWPPLMRSLCLFGDSERFGAPILDKSTLEAILGTTLDSFLRTGFALYAAARMWRGSVHRSSIVDGSLGLALQPLDAQDILEVVDRWFARPIAKLAQAGRDRTRGPDDLWGFNPFYDFPVALLDDGTYVIPSPRGVLQRLSPQGIYHIIGNAERHGRLTLGFQEFGGLLGERFQSYIGEQLGLIRHATVIPEIEYDNGRKSVDFFVKTPEVVLLVEAKSISPRHDTRSGLLPSAGGISAELDKASRQITATAELISAGHESFREFQGLPLRGLIVTREHYFNLAMPFINERIIPASVPATILSAQELEHALGAIVDEPDCGAQLLNSMNPHLAPVGRALNPPLAAHNPMLGDMWDKWADGWPQAPAVESDLPPIEDDSPA